MKHLSRVIVFGLGAVATYVSFAAPPTKLFQQPELARILFFHLPCAFLATFLLIYATFSSLRALQTRERVWDIRANAAMELTMLYCILTMVTGMVFSKAQWGAWWQRDPRQTSFLIVLLVVAAYFVLRLVFTDSDTKASISSAYVVGSFLPNVVLIFVLPRLPQVASFHPSDTLAGGRLDSMHWMIVLLVFVAVALPTIWSYRLRVRSSQLEIQLENLDGNLENIGDASAATGVVRPLSLSDSGGSEG